MLNKILSFFKPKIDQSDIKILVIEDNPVDQRLVCATIIKGGFTSLKADDGKSGLELAKSQRPDMIVLDYNLPDMQGPDIARILKADSDTQHIPILFLTSMTGPDNVINCFEQGENYLSKPISSKFLLKQIALIINNKKNRE